MHLLIIFISFIFSVFADGKNASPFATNPFWLNKPKVLSRMEEQREIVVSVKVDKKEQKIKVLNMSGAGIVKAPAQAAFLHAQKYSKLALISDYIKEVKVIDSDTIFVHTEAFRYHARMKMKVKAKSETESRHTLNFEVIEGNFRGMVGRFTFDEHQGAQTLLGFQALYNYEKLPMPEFFVEFGIEFVLKFVAQKLRSQLEKDAVL